MKKITALLLVCVMVCSMVVMASCGKTNDTVENLEGTYSREYEGTTINVFNWGEYISDGSEGSLDVNKAFEKLTGIKVNYSLYESNEAMYAKMKSEAVSYDIVIPSDYMIERLKNENMLQKIDTTKLSNYKYIDDEYKGLYFDENNEYSVPYSVGRVGLIYNTTMVKEAPTSWSVMWDKKYKENILTGIINKRIGQAVMKTAKSLSPKDIAYALKNFTLKVTGNTGFNYAQVTKGGISTEFIDKDTMQSKLASGFYVVGETLDVDGDCGGYNVTFAFISGIIAARSIKGVL